jgi:ABC-type glycerol-3-phosphate transport system substrate-binding protein
MDTKRPVTRPFTTRTIYSRRDMLKRAGLLGAGAAALTLPSVRSSYAAPAYLQGATINLKYGTWFWYEPGRAEAWRAMVEDFHAAQSDIRIEESGAAFNDFTNNIIVQLQAGGIEDDIVQTTPDLVLRLLDRQQLAPVQSVISDLGITSLSPAHGYITIDDNLYGLDVVTVAFGLLYNKALFDGAGVKEPTSIDEWVTTTTALTDRANNKFGIWAPHLMAEPESFWFQLQEWTQPYDGNWADGAKPLVTSEPVLKGLSLFKQMYDAAIPQGSNDATATRQFADKQVAQELIVSAAVNTIKDSGPDIYPDLRSAILPWPSKKTITRIHPITVNANGDNVDASIEFLKFLYTPENYRNLLTRQLDVIPSYDVGGLDDYFAGLPWLTGYKDIAPITPPEVMGDFIFYNQEFGNVVLTHFQNVLSGGQAVEDAMADAQTELEQLAEDLGLG